MGYVEPYDVTVFQTMQRQFKDEATKWDVIRDNTNRMCELISGRGKYYARPTKLAVFPEFCVQGSPGVTWYDITSKLPRNKAKPQTYKKIAVEIPNEATDKIGEAAIENGCYVVVPFIEIVKDWPDWPFISSTLISPKDGKVVLLYRKHCAPGMGYVPPADIYSEYVKKYGEDSFFPVADTPIGKIGLFVCCDCTYPEITRQLALRGAEVLCWSHGGITGGTPGSSLVLARARAIENTAYVPMANIGGLKDGVYPELSGGGYASIIDYRGIILAQAETVGESSATAEVDINAVRRVRATSMVSLVKVPTALYAKAYGQIEMWPLDSLENKPLNDMIQWTNTQKKVFKKLYDKKIFGEPTKV